MKKETLIGVICPITFHFFEVLFDVETQLDSLLQYVFIDSAVASMESK